MARRRHSGGGAARRGGSVEVEEIHAEMVSSVWKVLVAPGAQVAAGDTLVILESMKMEIPVLTEHAGTVHELHVVEGEVLQEGDLIATVAPR
jgi:biotin carboxyl carrier protein